MGPEPTTADRVSQTSTSTKARQRAKASTEAGPVQAHHLHGRRMNKCQIKKKKFHKNNFRGPGLLMFGFAFMHCFTLKESLSLVTAAHDC